MIDDLLRDENEELEKKIFMLFGVNEQQQPLMPFDWLGVA